MPLHEAPAGLSLGDASIWALFMAATLQLAAGVVVYPWATSWTGSPAALPVWYYAILMVVFGSGGAWLFAGGQNDVRARDLGLVLALFGCLFAQRLLERAEPRLVGAPGHLAWFLANLHLVAFVPVVFWRFSWTFPRTRVPARPRILPLVTIATGAIGVLLVVGNLAVLARGPAAGHAGRWATLLSPTADEGLFWQAVALAVLPSLLLLVRKFRDAPADEKRRLSVVILGLVVGSAPMLAHVLLVTAVPEYAAYAAVPVRSRRLGIALTAVALAIPVATIYAVLVDRALEVRFLIRRAVQYAFARYTALALIVGPAATLAVLAYVNRARPLGELVAGSPMAVLTLLLGTTLLLCRRPVLEAVDRRFFREHYDARRILASLVERSVVATSTSELASLVGIEVDRALHLERASVLVHDEARDELRDPQGRVRTLSTRGPLAALIGGSREPLDVDLASPASLLSRLPESDRLWLADAAARLIVPLFGARQSLIGFLALGDKRSELPFTAEDRELLTTVAASTALSLEQRLRADSGETDLPASLQSSRAAVQCEVCQRVQDRHERTCRACGGHVKDALVPAVVSGKFEVEQQIGAGGMGVVYRARDLALHRTVAIKVLPGVGAGFAERLRREARAMAAVQHPHLALVYGMESWRGTPVLVLEYLGGGTLADRLRASPVPCGEVVQLGLVIADVLDHLHRAGLFHRDIKPSNIGFTAEQSPKLLDFGLVHLVATASSGSTAGTTAGATERTRLSPSPARAGTGADNLAATDLGKLVPGTAAYLSPEAVALAPPGPMFDLWSLGVSLYEALTGRNPFAAPTLTETFSAILRANPPDVRQLRPDCPGALAEFLATALSASVDQRPRSAQEFLRRLRGAA